MDTEEPTLLLPYSMQTEKQTTGGSLGRRLPMLLFVQWTPLIWTPLIKCTLINQNTENDDIHGYFASITTIPKMLLIQCFCYSGAGGYLNLGLL